jgi:hypothetical protein
MERAAMLHKVIAAGILGLGMSTITMVPAAIPQPVTLESLSLQIRNLNEGFQRQAERLKNVEDAIERINAGTNANGTGRVPPDTSRRPTEQTTRVVHIHRHYYPRYWCPPWWGWRRSAGTAIRQPASPYPCRSVILLGERYPRPL